MTSIQILGTTLSLMIQSLRLPAFTLVQEFQWVFRLELTDGVSQSVVLLY
jgi:hypothetical protein